MTEHELLLALATFLNQRTFIQGDKKSILDMVQRYGNPPLTRLYQVAMRLTVAELEQLNALMREVNEHLQPTAQDEAAS